MNKLFITTSPHSTVVLTEQGEVLQFYQNLDQDFIQAIQKLTQQNNVFTDSRQLCDLLRNGSIHCTIEIDNPILSSWRKNRFENLLDKTNIVSDYSHYIKEIHDSALLETRKKIKKSAGKRDELAAQIIHAIDDMQKSYNLAANRLSELYSLHFPELVDNVSNPTTLARIISEFPKRDSILSDYLQNIGLPSNKISNIVKSAKDSLGGEFSEMDLTPIQIYASTLIKLDTQLKKLEKWIDSEMVKIAPNVTAVAGANVGARLISAMGSLRQLAMKPSSKIQTIGAERALYAALRGRGSPPKHGIIFQIPEIGNAPFWLRGKLARAYAGKIAIASRLDEFKGEFLGDKLRSNLREFEAKLRKQYPKPPVKIIDDKKRRTHPAIQRRRGRKKS